MKHTPVGSFLRKPNKLNHGPLKKQCRLGCGKVAEIFRKEIVQRVTRNLLDIQILRLIQREAMWGYKIKKQVETKFNVKLRHAALYPLLGRLEQESYVTSQKQREGGRTRKVYEITRKGREYLEAYMTFLKEQIEGSDIK